MSNDTDCTKDVNNIGIICGLNENVYETCSPNNSIYRFYSTYYPG